MKKLIYTFVLLLFTVAASNAQKLSSVAGIAGTDGSADGAAASAKFNMPAAIAVDTAGRIWVADYLNSTIRMITPDGQVHTRAGAAEMHAHVDATGITSRFFFPVGVAIGSNNEIYVADQGNNVIRKIVPFTTIGNPQAVSTLAGSGTKGSDNGTGSAATFDYITGIATAPNGDIYVTERDLHTIRKVTPAGVVTTFAGSTSDSGSANGSLTNARFNRPNGIYVASNGDIYVTESAGSRIRKISNGQVTTLAGGNTNYALDGHINDPNPAKRPGFFIPTGIIADDNGVVYVAENRCRIRRIANDSVSTFAGIYEDCGFLNGPATTAKLNGPNGLAWDKSGEKIIIADMGNHMIRSLTLVDEQDTTISGVAKDELLSVKVYPNPAKDIVNVQLPNDVKGNFTLSLYDMSGRKIENADFNGFTKTLNISDLSKGLYVLRVEQQGVSIFHQLLSKL